MASNTPDTSGKKKFAFRDIRTEVELLLSGRPPKSLKFITQNPVSKKLSKLGNKLKGKLTANLKSQAISLAAKAALGPVGGMLAAKLAGKIRMPGGRKITGGLSTVSKVAAVAGLGVAVVKELDPKNIRRPLKEGLSASASAAALPLAATVAASVVQSLVSGGRVASALPTPKRQFKTASALVKSPRFFNPTAAQYTLDPKEKGIADKAVKQVVISTAAERLYPQAGLLEDEIMYRLTLLAENVYAPTQTYAQAAGLGTIKILEGFRAENSGTSQHERGEAIDITVGDGSYAVASQCYQLAVWMRDHILYDQLILCFDISGGGQVWIHVSFNIDARRRQVLTKAFNDTHETGLHLYAPPVGTDVEADKNIAAGTKLLDTLAERQQRLQPIGLNTPSLQEETVKITGISGGGAGGVDGGTSGLGPQMWAWRDVGGPPVVGNTLDGYRAQFFAAIGKAPGDDASDWQTVLQGKFPINPAAGERFTGIYQQADSGGNVRGRLFLPTNELDDSGYYFHTIDVTEDKPTGGGGGTTGEPTPPAV